MRFLAIILLCIIASIIYGVIHDQITARICIEYFTIAHPPVFDTESPTLLGLGWGVIATWWVGAILGVALAISSRAGSLPKLGAKQLIKPIALMLLIVGALAAIAGAIGHAMAINGSMQVSEPFASQIAPEKHAAFLADAFAHDTSYTAGALGGIGLCIWVLISRMQITKR